MKMMNLPLSKINEWIEKGQLDDKMIQIVMKDDDKGYIYSNIYLDNDDVIKYELHIENGRIDHEKIWLIEADEEGGWYEMQQISVDEAFERRGLKEVWNGIWVKPEKIM